MAGFLSFVVPIFAIIGLVLYVSSSNKPAPGASNPEKALAERIQKVGMVEVRDANRPLRAGEEVYKGQCAACHATGAAGAPKLADAAAWAPRIKTGFEALVQSALRAKVPWRHKAVVISTTQKLHVPWLTWAMQPVPSSRNPLRLLLQRPMIKASQVY